MTTKHAPANNAPLPWEAYGIYDITCREGAVFYSDAGVGEDGAIANVKFTVHACNAYPMLVEALREAANRLAVHEAHDSAADALCVLRELGEL